MVLPEHVLSLGEWYHACSGLDLSVLVQLLGLVPHAVLLVRQSGIGFNELATSPPRTIEQIVLLKCGVELDKSVEVTFTNISRLDLGFDGGIFQLDQSRVPGIVCLCLVFEHVWRDPALGPGFGSTVED